MNPNAPSFDLTGRRALITGSSTGIGFGLARGLAAAGAHIVLNGRSADKMAQAAATLRAEGATVNTMAFDVSDGAAVTTAVARIEAEIGPIDILINNAGMQHRTPLEDFPQDKWHELMRTNVDSVFLVGQAVARHMIGRGRGKIINICSVMSEVGRAGIAPYTATKGAVKMLTKGMAIDWGPKGLQVNGIGPGYIKTELNDIWFESEAGQKQVAGFPRRHLGTEEDLDATLLLLCSRHARFITGALFTVDDGQLLA